MIVPTPTVAIDLTRFFPAWQSQAACKGVGPDRFFQELGGDTGPAREICATCPVLWECLEYGVTETKLVAGIWGGAGEADLRYFRKLRLRRTHGPEPVEDCRCAWCRYARSHRARLSARLLPEAERSRLRADRLAPPDRNGEGATHGLRSTQARGCRCAPCTWSASTLGVSLTKLGLKTSDLWAAWSAGVPDQEAGEVVMQAGEDLVVDLVAGLMWFSAAGPDGRRSATERMDERRVVRERRRRFASGDTGDIGDTFAA